MDSGHLYNINIAQYRTARLLDCPSGSAVSLRRFDLNFWLSGAENRIFSHLVFLGKQCSTDGGEHGLVRNVMILRETSRAGILNFAFSPEKMAPKFGTVARKSSFFSIFLKPGYGAKIFEKSTRHRHQENMRAKFQPDRPTRLGCTEWTDRQTRSTKIMGS